MKVCVPMKSTMVHNHFGKAPEFTIAIVEGGKVVGKDVVKNPGRENHLVIKLMPEQGVTHIITGGMGEKARVMLQEYNIVIVTGVLGSIDTALERFLKGELVSKDAPCANEHKCGM